MTLAVECDGASRRYLPPGGVPVDAIRGVDLEVERGEFVAVIGPSGSGKTTLIGLLAGFEVADSGSVVVLGHDMARLSAKEKAWLRRGHIGLVLQTYGLVASLSAGQNVALPLALDGASEVDRRTRAAHALDLVGLTRSYDARIDELSGGERQRVAIARAIAAGPALILADEPTGSLDDENAGAVLDLLVQLSESGGASLVLVTHDAKSAARATRRYQMLDGRLQPETR